MNTTPTRAQEIRAMHRSLARVIGQKLGDNIGNREAVILADPGVVVSQSAHYPGCDVVSAGPREFIYRRADNSIVG